MIAKEVPKVKHICDIIGEMSKWQINFICFSFILRASSAPPNMGYSFHAFSNDFWCSDVPEDYPNKTSLMKCSKFTRPNESCTEWQYDRSQFRTSITTEFNLVCDRAHFGSLTQSVYMLGYVVSGLVFAHYSDKYGRRPITWLSMTIEVIGIVVSAVSANIYMYTLSRFLVGLGSSGKWMSVYTMKICGPKYRSDVLILGGIGWVSGYALTPALAYWLQDFRSMQFVSAIPLILIMIWLYFLDESPRWQITNGFKDKAEQTLRKALKMDNKSDTDLTEQLNELSEYLKKVQTEDEITKTHTVLDLLKTSNLRKITLISWYSWIVNALIYYGFSLNMSDFGGNFYITFFLAGLVELPSQILTALLLRFIGRKKLFALFMLLTGVSCLAVIPAKSSWLKVTFALIGKFSVNSSWNVMAIHGPEMFPTILRQTGMGSASVVGRIGSISAPFMKNLALHTGLAVVMLLYCSLTTVGAIFGLFLPETKGREIPDTIIEAENPESIELKSIEKLTIVAEN